MIVTYNEIVFTLRKRVHLTYTVYMSLKIYVCSGYVSSVYMFRSHNLIKLRSRIKITETHSIISIGLSNKIWQIKRINLK